MKTFGSTTMIALFLLIFINGIQAQSEKQDKKLMKTLRRNHEKIKDPLILLQKVNNVNYTDSDGSSFLILASFFGYTEVCEMLIDKGANLDLQRSDGLTALHAAINTEFKEENKEYLEIVKLLIDKGANLDLPWFTDHTPLMLSSLIGQTEIVKLLIDKGANLDLQSTNGSTALVCALRTDVVKLLIDKGAKLDLQIDDGRTALIVNSSLGFTENVKLLLEKGANPNLNDDEGKTAYDYAKNSEIKSLLTTYMKK